eukprot:g13351.t1
MFTLTNTGDYILCYRVAGAKDSVAQSGVKLEVKPPGVTKDMVGRWQRKDGKLDCTTLDYVPFCGVSLEEKCGRTYYVQSGIGYKCKWDEDTCVQRPTLTLFQEVGNRLAGIVIDEEAMRCAKQEAGFARVEVESAVTAGFEKRNLSSKGAIGGQSASAGLFSVRGAVSVVLCSVFKPESTKIEILACKVCFEQKSKRDVHFVQILCIFSSSDQ